MTKILWALAALLIVSDAGAKPGDTLQLNFNAQACAAFHGAFNEDGYKGEVDGKINAKCTIVDGGGATCNLTFVGKDGTIGDVDFVGTYVMKQSGKAILTIIIANAPKTESVGIRVYCSDDHCEALQFFNSESKKGLMCKNPLPQKTTPDKTEPLPNNTINL